MCKTVQLWLWQLAAQMLLTKNDEFHPKVSEKTVVVLPTVF